MMEREDRSNACDSKGKQRRPIGCRGFGETAGLLCASIERYECSQVDFDRIDRDGERHHEAIGKVDLLQAFPCSRTTVA